MPPSPRRGSLPARIRAAMLYTEARMKLMMKAMDEATDTGGEPPFGGGVLSQQDFQSVLLNDPAFQQRLAAGLVFASEPEKAALRGAVDKALADQQDLLRTLGQPPAPPTWPGAPREGEERRT